MNADMVEVIEYDDIRHRREVIGLWDDVCDYDAKHSQPGLAIDKKVAVADGLFFVALKEGDVVGTVMAGYDGHRGWIYSIAPCLPVLPETERFSPNMAE